MKRWPIVQILALNLAWPSVVMSEETPTELYRQTDSTYSIIARDPETGLLGLGVQSRALSIGNRVVTAKGGVAIVAHQSSSNPMYGKLIIDGIERGMTPPTSARICAARRQGAEPAPGFGHRHQGPLGVVDEPDHPRLEGPSLHGNILRSRKHPRRRKRHRSDGKGLQVRPRPDGRTPACGPGRGRGRRRRPAGHAGSDAKSGQTACSRGLRRHPAGHPGRRSQAAAR